jgi:DNA-binding Lrp family transcriptional regulator
VAVINAEQLGMKAEGILFANLDEDVTADKLKSLSNVPGVMEVLQVSGRRRVMIRLHAPDNRNLEEIIQKEIVPLGLVDLELRIVLDSLMRFPGV